jgi:hypothetical protein
LCHDKQHGAKPGTPQREYSRRNKHKAHIFIAEFHTDSEGNGNTSIILSLDRDNDYNLETKI